MGRDLVIPGRGVAPGVACGPLQRNRAGTDPASMAGKILVAERATPDDADRILASAGTLALTGAPLSHVSMISAGFGKPALLLHDQNRIRLAPAESGSLLQLSDGVVLREGDVVVLDADRDLLRIPGGPGARRQVRAIYGSLKRLALDELVPAGRRLDGPLIRFTLEACFLAGLVRPGRAGLAVLKKLALSSAKRELDGAVTELADALEMRAGERMRAAARAIARSDDARTCDAVVEQARRGAVDDIARLELLGGRVAHLRSSLAGLEAEADARRQELARADRAARRRARRRADRCDPLFLEMDGEGPCTDRVGGKARGLLAVRPLLDGCCRIPPGRIATTSCYELHLQEGPGERLRRLVEKELDPARLSRLARAALLGSPAPREVRLAVSEAWTALGGRPLVVRSSATLEDAPRGAISGLFDTFVGVRSESELLETVRWVWASLWNRRALSVLAALGRSPMEERQAVLIQHLVSCRVAGVLSPCEPERETEVALVNAAWGLGEAISQGEVSGDVYRLCKRSGRALAVERGGAKSKLLPDPKRRGTVAVDLSEAERDVPCLGARELARLAELARRLDEGGAGPRQVEFGFDEGGELWLFQARPFIMTGG